MDQISNLKIKLEAETAKFTEEINKARKSLDWFGKTTGGINLTKIAIGGLATAALAATGAVVSFVSSLGDGIKIFEETERYMARTEAQLRATGSAVGFSSSEMDKFARSVAMNTLASTDGVRQAMSVMMTFKSVTGESFKEAIKLSQDLAETFGTDISSEARNLGRALESPAEAISILKRKGIELTSEQQNLINSFVETGDKAKAQEIIFKALQDRVGGTGESAASGTLSGSLDTLGQVTDELKEQFAKTTGITDLFKGAVDSLSGAFVRLTKAMKGVDTATHVKNLENEISILEKSKKSLEQQFESGAFDGSDEVLAAMREQMDQQQANLDKARAKLKEEQDKQKAEADAAESSRKKAEQEEKEKAGKAQLEKIEDKLKSRKQKLTEQLEIDQKAINNLELSKEEIEKRGFKTIEQLREAELNKLKQNYDEQTATVSKGESKKAAIKSSRRTSDVASLDMQYANEMQKLDLQHQQRIAKINGMAISEKDAKERNFSSALELRKHYLELEAQAYDQALEKQKAKEIKEDKDRADKVRSFFNDIRGSGNDPYVQSDITREDQLVKAQELYEQQLINVQQFEEAKALIEDQYRKRKEDLDRQAMTTQLNIAASLFDGLAGLAESAGGKQSAAYRTLFAISKSFQIAESLINLHAAVMKAMNDPTAITPAQKFANMAAVASQGAAVLNQLKSVTISGARASGGYVGGGRTYLVGEKGPELFTPGASGQITSNSNLNKALGGASNKTVVINQTNNFGDGDSDPALAEKIARLTRAQVYDVLRNESRSGGMLR
nr:MAG TPA: tail tape measure protein [Bacteriophage sp.]